MFLPPLMPTTDPLLNVDFEKSDSALQSECKGGAVDFNVQNPDSLGTKNMST